MAYLTIKNKKDFVSNFLGPVSNLNENCILTLRENTLDCILASADGTIVCKASIEIETDILEEKNLNLPDIKKLVRVIDIIPSDEIKLKINENSISFNDKGYKFKYHLLDDGIIKQPSLNVEKVNKLNFNKESIMYLSDKEKYNYVNEKLKILKKLEYSLISLFDEDYTNNINFQSLYFSDILERLNNNVYILNTYTLFNIHYAKYYILSPIIIIIIPILLTKCLPCFNFLRESFLYFLHF